MNQNAMTNQHATEHDERSLNASSAENAPTAAVESTPHAEAHAPAGESAHGDSAEGADVANAAAAPASAAQDGREAALRKLVETGRRAAFAHPRGERSDAPHGAGCPEDARLGRSERDFGHVPGHRPDRASGEASGAERPSHGPDDQRGHGPHRGKTAGDREHARERRLGAIAAIALKDLSDDEVAALVQTLDRIDRALAESCDIPEHPHGRPAEQGRPGDRGPREGGDGCGRAGHGRPDGRDSAGHGRPEGFGPNGGRGHRGRGGAYGARGGHGSGHGHGRGGDPVSARGAQRHEGRAESSPIDVHGDPVTQGFSCPRGKRAGVDCPTCFPQCGFGRARYA